MRQYWRERLFVAKRWSQQPAEPSDIRGSRSYAIHTHSHSATEGLRRAAIAVGAMVSGTPHAQNFVDQMDYSLHFCRDIGARI